MLFSRFWKKSFLLVVLLNSSCYNNNSNESEQQSYRDSERKIEENFAVQQTPETSSSKGVSEYVGSQILENQNVANRKFIRSAEMRMRVKDVYNVSLVSESIISRLGGFITYTNLQHTQNYTQTIPISKDSVLEVTYYTVNNHIQGRVPVKLLDSALREIARHAEYIDYRILRAEDVTLRELANRLAIERAKKSEKRPEREDRDQAIIDNLRLEDEVSYSTLQLYLYQRQLSHRQVLPNTQVTVEEYKPSYLSKLKDAFLDSFNILGEAVLIVVRIWLVFLFALLLYWGYRKWRNRN